MADTDRCLIVVVLYRMRAQDSATVCGVVAALQSDAALREGYELLLWENTSGNEEIAGPSAMPAFDIPFRYERAVINDGVAGAFNGGMQRSTQDGHEWMLLLDQDTAITAEYLQGMSRYRRELHIATDVAAIVPLLLDGDFQLSPKRVLRFRDQAVVPGQPGELEGEVFAANSGIMMRASALQSVGGYSLDFWLDHSDMYVFHRLHMNGWKVYFAADLRLQHSMTMLDYDTRMTPERYENFLSAEQAFFDLYRGTVEHSAQALRLLLRGFRQRRRYRDKIYSTMTWKFLLRRLVTTKTARLQAFRQRAVERRQSALRETPGIGR